LLFGRIRFPSLYKEHKLAAFGKLVLLTAQTTPSKLLLFLFGSGVIHMVQGKGRGKV